VLGRTGVDAHAPSGNPEEPASGKAAERWSAAQHPSGQPVFLSYDIIDVIRRCRVDFNIRHAVTTVAVAISDRVVPLRIARVSRAQMRLQVNAASPVALSGPAFHSRAMFALQRLKSWAATGCDVRCGTYCRLEFHSCPRCSASATTFATTSAMRPLNSLRPPQPLTASLSEPGSRSEMSVTVGIRLGSVSGLK